MPKQSKIEQIILKELKPYHNKERADHDIGYMNTQYDCLGISVPNARKVAKIMHQLVPETYSYAHCAEVFLTTTSFDVKTVLLFVFQTSDLSLIKDQRFFWKLIDGVDNWAHSDQLSSMYAQAREASPKEVDPLFRKWEQSKDAWKRRQSLVSLFYYSSQRKKYPPFGLCQKRIKLLLDDEAYYVQKGVGWTMREMYNVYPQKTQQLLSSIVKQLSPVAWQAATEKLPPEEKARLKQQRQSKT